MNFISFVNSKDQNMFSKACEYAIKASIYIALKSQNGERVSLKDIAARIDSPEAFTAKILQKLAHKHIVSSLKGAAGGFEINREKIRVIKLAHIVDAIDGDAIYRGCALGLHRCDGNHPCPVHFQFIRVRDDLKNVLEQTSLEDLALELGSGLAYLKV